MNTPSDKVSSKSNALINKVQEKSQSLGVTQPDYVNGLPTSPVEFTNDFATDYRNLQAFQSQKALFSERFGVPIEQVSDDMVIQESNKQMLDALNQANNTNAPAESMGFKQNMSDYFTGGERDMTGKDPLFTAQDSPILNTAVGTVSTVSDMFDSVADAATPLRNAIYDGARALTPEYAKPALESVLGLSDEYIQGFQTAENTLNAAYDNSDVQAYGKYAQDAITNAKGAGETLAAIGDIITEDPGTALEMFVTSTPYMAAMANPMTAVASLAGLSNDNTVEMSRQFIQDNGRMPNDKELGFIRALGTASAVVDAVGDKLLADNLIKPIIKKTSPSILNKVIKPNNKLVKAGLLVAGSGVSEFGTEGGAEALKNIGVNQGELTQKGIDNSLAAGALGAASGISGASVLSLPAVSSSTVSGAKKAKATVTNAYNDKFKNTDAILNSYDKSEKRQKAWDGEGVTKTDVDNFKDSVSSINTILNTPDVVNKASKEDLDKVFNNIDTFIEKGEAALSTGNLSQSEQSKLQDLVTEAKKYSSGDLKSLRGKKGKELQKGLDSFLKSLEDSGITDTKVQENVAARKDGESINNDQSEASDFQKNLRAELDESGRQFDEIVGKQDTKSDTNTDSLDTTVEDTSIVEDYNPTVNLGGKEYAFDQLTIEGLDTEQASDSGTLNSDSKKSNGNPKGFKVYVGKGESKKALTLTEDEYKAVINHYRQASAQNKKATSRVKSDSNSIPRYRELYQNLVRTFKESVQYGDKSMADAALKDIRNIAKRTQGVKNLEAVNSAFNKLSQDVNSQYVANSGKLKTYNSNSTPEPLVQFRRRTLAAVQGTLTELVGLPTNTALAVAKKKTPIDERTGGYKDTDAVSIADTITSQYIDKGEKSIINEFGLTGDETQINTEELAQSRIQEDLDSMTSRALADENTKSVATQFKDAITSSYLNKIEAYLDSTFENDSEAISATRNAINNIRNGLLENIKPETVRLAKEPTGTTMGAKGTNVQNSVKSANPKVGFLQVDYENKTANTLHKAWNTLDGVKQIFKDNVSAAFKKLIGDRDTSKQTKAFFDFNMTVRKILEQQFNDVKAVPQGSRSLNQGLANFFDEKYGTYHPIRQLLTQSSDNSTNRLDNNIVAAISAAIINYAQTASTYKTDEEMADALGLTGVPTGQRLQILRDIKDKGEFRTVTADSIGSEILSSLGISFDKSEAVAEHKDQIKTALGTLALSVMAHNNMIEVNSMKASTFANKMTLLGIEKQASEPESEVVFVKIKTKKGNKFQKSDEINNLTESVKFDDGVSILDAFGFQTGIRGVSLKPIETDIVGYNEFDTQLPKSRLSKVSKLQKTKWYIDGMLQNLLSTPEGELAVLNELVGNDYAEPITSIDEEAINDWLDSNVVVGKRDDVKYVIEGHIEALKRVRETLEYLTKQGWDNSQPIYLEYDVYKQGRFSPITNGINPQANKFHRVLATPSTSDRNITQSKMQDSTFRTRTLLGIATMFGMDEKTPFATKQAYLKTIQYIYKSDKANSLIQDVVDSYENDGQYDSKALDAAFNRLNAHLASQNLVTLHTKGLNRMFALQELSNLYKTNDGNKYITRHVVEVDGITNGFAILMMQVPVLSDIMGHLGRIGIFRKNAEVDDVSDFFGSGKNQDSYESLITKTLEKTPNVINKKLDKVLTSSTKYKPYLGRFRSAVIAAHVKGNSKGTAPTTTQLTDTATKLVLKATKAAIVEISRDLAKYPFMTFNYSASLETIRGNVAYQVASSFYDRLQEMHTELLANPGNKSMQKNMKIKLDNMISDYAGIGVNLKGLTINNLGTYKLDDVSKKGMEEVLGDIVGTAMSSAIDETLGKLNEVRDMLNQSAQMQYEIFLKQYTKRKQEIIEENLNNNPKHVPFTMEDADNLIKELKPFIPSFSGYGAKEGENFPLFKLQKTTSKDGKAVVQIKFPKKSGVVDSATVSTQSKDIDSIGIGTGAMTVQQIDAAIMTNVTEFMSEAAHVHDAIKLLGTQSVDGAIALNKEFYEINKDYSIVQDGLSSFAAKLELYYAANNIEEPSTVNLVTELLLDKINRGDNVGTFKYYDLTNDKGRKIKINEASDRDKSGYARVGAVFFLNSISRIVDEVNAGRSSIFNQKLEVQQYPSPIPDSKNKSGTFTTSGDAVSKIVVPEILQDGSPSNEEVARIRNIIDSTKTMVYTRDMAYLDYKYPPLNEEQIEKMNSNLDRLVRYTQDRIKKSNKNSRIIIPESYENIKSKTTLGSDGDIAIEQAAEYLMPEVSEVTEESLLDTATKLEAFDKSTQDLSSEHKGHLYEVISKLLNNGLDYVNDITVRVKDASQQRGGIELSSNTVTIQLNTTGKPDLHSKSGLELLVHEITHGILEPTIRSDSPKIRSSWNQIDRIMSAIKNKYSKDDLINILSRYVEGNSKEEARRVLDYTLYNSKNYNSTQGDGHVGTAEFVAYGTSNEAFIKMLRDLELNDNVGKDNRKILEKISDFITDILQKFWYPMADAKYDGSLTNNIDKEVFKAITTIVEAQKDANRRSVIGFNRRMVAFSDKVDSLEKRVSEAVGNKIESSFNKIKSLNIKNNSIDGVKAKAISVLSAKFVAEGMPTEDAVKKADLLLNNATDRASLNAALDSVGLGSESSFGKVINNILGDADGASINKMFRMFKKVVEHDASATESAISKIVLDGFKNSLTKVQERGLTKMLVATDARALFKHLGNSEMFKKVLTNMDSRKKLISTLESQLESVLKEYKDPVLAQARGLAKQMVNGVPSQHNQMSNVNAILSGQAYYSANAEYAKKFGKDLANVDRDLLDTYISAVALDSVYDNDAVTAINNDYATNNGEGINTLMHLLETYNIESKASLFDGSEFLMRKGHYAEMYNKEHDFELKPLSSKDELTKQGYELITGKLHSPMLSGYGLFVRRALGGSEAVSGPLNNILLHSQGTDINAIVDANPNLSYSDADSFKGNYKNHESMAAYEQQVLGKSVVTKGESTIPMPILNSRGFVVNYSYHMEEKQKANALDKDYTLSRIMGRSFSQNIRKVNSRGASSEMLQALHEDYLNNYDSNPNDFVWVSDIPNVDAVTLYSDEWRKTPPEIRQRANSMFGGKGIPVRKHHVRTVFGGHKMSVTNSYYMELAQGLFPDYPLTHKVGQLEQAIKELVSIAKSDIVIKTPEVLTSNIISNTITLWLRGVPIDDAFKDQLDAVRFLREYELQEAEAIKFTKLAESELDENKKQDLIERAARVRTKLKNNPINHMVEAGLHQTIIEDIELGKDGYLDAFREWSIEKGGKAADVAYTGLDWMYMNKRTPMYKFMAKSTQFSDFAARYSLIKNEKRKNNKLPADKRLSDDQITQDAVDTFVNYDMPDGKGLEYMNDMGLTMFTKFFFGVQRVIHKLAVKRLVSASSAVVLQAMLYDAEDVIDSSILMKNWGNLFYGWFTIGDTVLTPEGITLLKDIIESVGLSGD